MPMDMAFSTLRTPNIAVREIRTGSLGCAMDWRFHMRLARDTDELTWCSGTQVQTFTWPSSSSA